MPDKTTPRVVIKEPLHKITIFQQYNNYLNQNFILHNYDKLVEYTSS